MKFDNDSVDVSRVSDRRGGRGGAVAATGGGLGIVGVLVFLVLQALSGGQLDTSVLTVPTDGPVGQQADETSQQQLADRCNADGALEQYTDCRIIKVFNVTDATWTKEFQARGLDYRQPSLAFFSGQTQTGGCGAASAQVGPFYCPGDETMYFELDFLAQLQSQFGAPGEFAQAYIVAHEFGHHLQTLLGTETKVRQAQQQDPGNANQYGIAMELQADCYAGVWSKLADANEGQGIVLTSADVNEALAAAAAVGDDRIQQKTQGQVNPETWTHGSSQQRQEWFKRGLTTGDIDQCDTFTS